MRIGKLELIVFVCGAAVMVVELLGSRVLAPYMGNSIYTWASLIGVVLGALAFGYYIGGRAADRSKTFRVLGFVVLGAALATFAIIPLSPIAQLAILTGPKLGPLIASIILFAPASILFGMVSPYAIRLKAEQLSKVGSTAGNLYAISTTGSIFGTLLAGFVLIPSFGVKGLLLSVGAAVALASFLCFTKKSLGMLAPAAIVFLAGASLFPMEPPSPGTVVYSAESEYHLIRIVDNKEMGMRSMLIDIFTQSSEYFDSDELAIEYMKCSLVALEANPNPERVLFLGLGGGTLPKYFLAHTNATIDVIELDPAVISSAKDYFGVEESGRMRIMQGDARSALRQLNETYDMIYMDVFTSHSIPFHLTTVEFMQEVKGHLHRGGFLAMNLISAAEGHGSGFFASEYFTCSEIFAYTYAFPTKNDPSEKQNIILLASDSSIDFENSEIECAANYLPNPDTEGAVLLTDDFAPVDNLIATLYD